MQRARPRQRGSEACAQEYLQDSGAACASVPRWPRVRTNAAEARVMLRNFAWSLIPVRVVVACAPAPEGRAPTTDVDGPEIGVDVDGKALPEIPFPNDLATRPDPSSPTGKRVNASMIAPTGLEATARRSIDQLSGWGVYQPITVRFDAPIDLQVIYDRHRDYRNGAPDDYDFENDAIYLIDVTPTSPTYLEPTPLDFGEGNFP